MPSQFINYGCCNLVDGCRTLAYLEYANHVFAPGVGGPNSGFTACGCCISPDLDEVPVGGFKSPKLDPAPWYSASDPRSEHYFGPMLLSWTESQPYLRETIETRVGGKAKSPKLKTKDVVARFLLNVDDACAIPFAKTHFLQRLICASTDQGACGLPSLEWHECYNPSNCNSPDYAIRGLPRAAATSVTWIDDEIPACLGTIAEVVFSSELPWVYEMCPDEIVVDEYPIVAGVSACNICIDECPPVEDPCVNECTPSIVEVPSVLVTGCYCEPASIYRNAFIVNPDSKVGDGTLEISVYTGSHPMRNLRVRAWPNPLGLTTFEEVRCTDPCFDIALPGPFPGDSTIVIDGKSRLSTLACNGGVQNGRSWIESPNGQPFNWPDIGCDGLLVVMDSSAMVTAAGVPHTADDAIITVKKFHRELR